MKNAISRLSQYTDMVSQPVPESMLSRQARQAFHKARLHCRQAVRHSEIAVRIMEADNGDQEQD